MIRKVHAGSLFLLLLVGLVSCRKTPSEYKSDSSDRENPIEDIVAFDFDKIKERGYIVAIIDNSSTGLFQYRGQTMGYEYELLKMFADSMGLQLRLRILANLEEAISLLNSGEGDVLAYNLTVTKERKKRIAFTQYHNLVRQVLVQRKPTEWRSMKLHEIEKELIRNPVELIGKEVYVRYHSAYLDRLQNLSDEIGGDIIIIEDYPEVETESIIKKVVNGEIEYTIAEEDIALVNTTYYPILDVKTPVGFPQQIAWGVRKNADSLLFKMNEWIIKMKKTPEYYVVYDRYFRSSKASKVRNKSKYSSMGGGKLSPYDELIKKAADSIGWDWRLLAAQIFKESKFNPRVVSWAGAIGLLQIIPRTGEDYGINNLKKPKNNINAGVQHILWLQEMWEKEIEDPEERLKFILASYNVGHGHVFDAIRLAQKYDANPNKWEEVKEFLLKKEDPEYYNDDVVEFGYCRGSEPLQYVEVILETYDNYKGLFPDPVPTENIDPRF